MANENVFKGKALVYNSEPDKRLDAINHGTEEDLNGAKAFLGNGFSEHIRFE